jgi:radical SAM protein with 4Fe4S-binding SPASM domain
MIERVYVEIGNICNLSCSFCIGTGREKRFMTAEEFERVCSELSGVTRYVYLHVLGEPLLHPLLSDFLLILKKYGLRCAITTNGTMLDKTANMLLSRADVIHKVQISLHSIEGSGACIPLSDYLSSVCDFATDAADVGIYTVLRLWNEDSDEGKGKNSFNEKIREYLKSRFQGAWQERRKGSFRISKNIFLEYQGVFTWPKEGEASDGENGRCHGVIDQLAILADGSVCPCCLDSEGEVTFGNIFESPLDSILNSKRLLDMRHGFLSGVLTEELCKRCTYRKRFSK